MDVQREKKRQTLLHSMEQSFRAGGPMKIAPSAMSQSKPIQLRSIQVMFLSPDGHSSWCHLLQRFTSPPLCVQVDMWAGNKDQRCGGTHSDLVISHFLSPSYPCTSPRCLSCSNPSLGKLISHSPLQPSGHTTNKKQLIC